MKNLDFEITYHDTRYEVHLGNKEWLYFKNITRAQKFVRKYKAIIKDNVGILNSLQPQINLLYRQNIFHFDPMTQRQLSEKLKFFDERFEYIFKSYSPGNKNAFIFSSIGSCFEYLKDCAKILYAFAKKYKNYVLISMIRPLLKNLDMLKVQMESDKYDLFVKNGYVKDIKVLQLDPVKQDNLMQKIIG